MDRVQGQTSPSGPLILPLSLLQTAFLLTGSWNTLSPSTSHTGCINIKCVCVRACVRVCVCARKRESLDTKLCFQLNNSAPFQQYQDPGGREQKRKQAEGRRKAWRELVALRTAVIILPVLSAECSCHISVGTELKDEWFLPSFSLFLSDSYRYRILYLYHFPALAFCLIQKSKIPKSLSKLINTHPPPIPT